MGGSHSLNTFDIRYETNSVDLIGRGLNAFTIISPLEQKIKYINVTNNEFKLFPENMTEIILINLSKNKMGPLLPVQIAKEITKYSKLKTLYLSSNQLEGFNDFLHNESLETLYVQQNRIQQLPDNFFKRFPLLKTLELNLNFFKELSNQESDSLTLLTLYLNNIRTIDTSHLLFSHLTSLNLAKNEIETIPIDFSKSFPVLASLDMSYNMLKEVPDGSVFPETLRELRLSFNFIEKVPNSVTSLPNLKDLYIDNNCITALPKMQPSLFTLSAASNKISSVEEQVLPNLTSLAFNYNELTSFPTEITAEKCTSVFVSHNRIRRFDTGSPFPATVTVIDASFNEIEKVPKELFESLPDLLSFSVVGNKIDELPEEIAKCKDLLFLDLSDNPLKKLPKLPRGLLRITASNCGLESFEDAFVALQPPTVTAGDDDVVVQDDFIGLRHADFSRNSLESFPDFPRIEILNLSQNRLKKWPAVTDTMKIVDLSMNCLGEDVPDELRGNSLIELNLSFNELTKIPSIEKVPFLQTLEISGNPITAVIDVTNLIHLHRINITDTARVTFLNENEDVSHEVIRNDRVPQEGDPMRCPPIYVVQKKSKSGFSEMTGLRESMEDAIIVRDDLNLYAVCDGHGGYLTATFASIHLASIFEESVRQKPPAYDQLAPLLHDVFSKMVKLLQTMPFDDGSTLCVCLVARDEESEGSKVVTGHLGDARALVVTEGGLARALTNDHKPSMRSEFERIHRSFARLSYDNRVDSVLAVARSIGDYKVNGVGREIEVNEYGIRDDDRFLVVCCDGVFDMLSNEQVAKVVAEAGKPREAAFALRNAAFAAGSSDNISTIVVDLKVE